MIPEIMQPSFDKEKKKVLPGSLEIFILHLAFTLLK